MGAVTVFAPLLAFGAVHWHALWAVWLAKGLFNVWRVGICGYRIHCQWLTRGIGTL